MDESRLRELMEEAIVDAHDEYEQIMGFEGMFGDQLPFPFQADALGETVQVTDLSSKDGGRTIYVTIEKNGKEYPYPIADLENVQLDEETAAWIAAYKFWLSKQ